MEAKRFVRLCLLAMCLVTVACGETNGGRDAGNADDAGSSGGDNNSSGTPNNGSTNKPDGGDPIAVDSGPDAEMPPIDTRRQKVVSVAPPYGVAGESYGYSPKSDQASETAWAVKNGPTGMAVDEKSKNVAWTPSQNQGGKHEVEIEGTAGDKAVTQTYEMYVAVPEKQAQGIANPKSESVVTVSSPKSDLQGTTVYTAPGAVKEPVDISISKVDEAPPMREAKGEITAVQFGPSGTVFQQPALVALPLSAEADPDLARVGAFVYNPEGHWERVPVVRVDLANRLVYARALHFSTYAAAESAFALDASLAAMPSSSACEGEIVARATLVGALSDLQASVVNNLPAELRALVRGGVTQLTKLLAQANIEGSFRFSRVLTLWSGPASARVKVDEQLLVTTLYLPGDGSARITHSDALGNEVASFDVASLVNSFAEVESHLRGAHTHALFPSAPSGVLSLSARMHVAFYEGDAAVDAASADDLGLALVNAPAGEPAAPALGGDLDLDCDGLHNLVDALDNRQLPGFDASPRTVVSSVVGSPVRLAVTLRNAPENPPISFEVLAGAATLSAVDGEPNARDLLALKPGRYLVEARADAAGTVVSHVFAVDMLPAGSVPACSLSASSGQVKVGEKVTLTAALAESSLATSALSFEWGTLSEGTFSAFAGPDATNTTIFAPLSAGTLTLGCRASDGVTTGDTGTLTLDVLSADQNRAPHDLLLSPPASTIVVGESAALVASASDPDGDALTFTWSAASGTLGTASVGEGSSSNTFQAPAGLHEITVAVSDGKAPPTLLHASVLVVTDRAVLDAADADGDGWPTGVGLDCNDANAKVHPGSFDTCADGLDNDCDGTERETDCDNDGVSTQQGDCNDANALIRPEAFEYCDGIDNDCDQAIDERELNPVGGSCFRGVGTCATTGVFVCASDTLNTLCNAAAVAPTTELCNGLDDNCDGVTSLEEIDNDGDGLAECAGDCDDTRENVRAGRSDLCDAVDNDCDGSKDEDHVAEATSCGVGVCSASGVMACVNGETVNSCQIKQPTGLDDDCDGVDDDCDGKTDESFASEVSCGVGVCQTSGSATCSNGHVNSSCTPLEGAPNDSACNGQDDDCDGKTDEDAVKFPVDVCNGIDDDCNGTLDPVSCEGGEVDPSCVSSTETCNMRDDDCDGAVDNGNVCGVSLSSGSLLGAWWRCVDATCQTLTPFGLFFTSIPAPENSFRAFSLSSLDQQPYVPSSGPYCGDGALAYTHNQATGALVVISDDGDSQEQAVGTVVITGQRARVQWTTPPPDDAGAFELMRVPEQSAGHCGPEECGVLEVCGNQVDDNCDGLIDNGCPGGECFPEDCDNGIDDDCDKATDGADTDCGAACVPRGTNHEQCNGQDDDCDGQIDELNSPCELPNLFGACAFGQLFCGPNGEGSTCKQVNEPGAEYCDDARDTDCDNLGANDGEGLENNEANCQTLAEGEACFNAIDISQGGTYSVAFQGAVRNEVSGCGTLPNARDRVYRFNLPPNPLGGDHEVFLKLNAPHAVGVPFPSATLFTGDCQGGQRQCLSSDNILRLPSGNYFVVVHAPANAVGVTLSFAHRASGACDGECGCLPGDLDEDGATICAGDCRENNEQIGPYETEACNGEDDDCNGQVDDVAGTCTLAASGVCNLGRSSCAAGETVCTSVYTAGVEYCNDEVDSDCDGNTSSSEGDCDLSDAGGETCFGAILMETVGGTFFGTLEGANDDLSLPSCHNSDGAEHVYAFEVPTGFDYRSVSVRRVGAATTKLDFSIVRDCESLTVERCLGASGSTSLDDSGIYYLVVEGDPGPYGFTLAITGDRECVTPDLDGDGYDACYGDCDETDDAINMDANESTTCDGIDNDCKGGIDDVHGACDVQALLGECRKGTLDCDIGCEQVTYAQDSVEVCDDGLDNDCDGDLDDEGEAGIDCTLAGVAGETCGTAIDVSVGGRFEGSLAGALDNADTACGAAINAPDQFFRLTLQQRRQVSTRVVPHLETVPGGIEPRTFVAVLDGSCSRAGHIACTGNSSSGSSSGGGSGPGIPGTISLIGNTGAGNSVTLDPGTYFLVVEGPAGMTFDLDVWSQLEAGGPETCIPGDLDEDGQNACEGDCGEGNPEVYKARMFCPGKGECGFIPGAPELCDGLDNDCDSAIDDINEEACTVDGAPGVCAAGRVTCDSGATGCESITPPGLERCGDALDTDCDGKGTDVPENESDCTQVPPGDMCFNAIDISAGGLFQSSLTGMAADGFACTQEALADRYFVFTPNQNGFLFIDVKPLGAPQNTVVLSQLSESCQSSGLCAYPNSPSGYSVSANKPYYFSVASSEPLAFQLRVAFGVFGQTVTCTASGTEGGDFDSDGVSLCNQDCNEANPNVHPGQVELCNSIDDNCNGTLDDISDECTVPGQQGECAHGHAYECNGNQPICSQTVEPSDEYCFDQRDTNCNGSAATDEVDCINPQ